MNRFEFAFRNSYLVARLLYAFVPALRLRIEARRTERGTRRGATIVGPVSKLLACARGHPADSVKSAAGPIDACQHLNACRRRAVQGRRYRSEAEGCFGCSMRSNDKGFQRRDDGAPWPVSGPYISSPSPTNPAAPTTGSQAKSTPTGSYTS